MGKSIPEIDKMRDYTNRGSLLDRQLSATQTIWQNCWLLEEVYTLIVEEISNYIFSNYEELLKAHGLI